MKERHGQLIACVFILAGCAIGGRDGGTPPGDIERVLVAEIARDLSSDSMVFEVSRLTVTRQPSSVFRGLSYHWGEYRPRISHGRIVALVAQDSSILLVRNQADWQLLWRRRGIPIRSNTEAIAVCTEFIQMTGSVRGSRPVAEFYSAPMDLTRLNVVNAGRIEEKAGPPVAHREAGTWVVDLWQLQPWQTIKYSCRIAPGEVRYFKTDSIPASGLIGR